MIERDSIDERDLAILESTPIPIFIHQDLLFVWMNRAAEQLLIGLGKVQKREDVYGQSAVSWAAPEEPTDIAENSLRVQEQGEEVTEQRRTFVTRTGDRINCLGSARSVLWKGRPAVEVVILFSDYIPSDPSLLPGHAPPSLSTLTPAQLRVAIKLAQGYGTKEIARLLSITEGTVQAHLSAVYAKTGTHSRTDLMRLLLGVLAN
ncbi:MAG: LuxR C-terminal-related transcriptional regulator [Myxococcota bacterium]|jgi:PAS domain S-box-containing protein|nr:LuxR C-terminal-related transcriptional regulator [Myxococcota bacterium]